MKDGPRGTSTIKDVADAAGVSTAAVSLFLNDRPGISQATRDRIAAAIESLGYVPRGSASRRSSSGASNFVSLLVEKLPLSLHSDHFYSAVAQGVQAEAERLGYNLVLTVVDPNQQGLPRALAEQHVAGAVALGGGDITDTLLDAIKLSEIPLVVVDNQSNSSQIDCVVTDNQYGTYQLIRYLAELGHRRIAIILGPEKYKSLNERYIGYRQAMFDLGLGFDESLVQPNLSQGIPRKGYLEMMSLLDRDPWPTAVFAVSDRTALGALEALRERGIEVPRQISLAGFDGIEPGQLAKPALTTVSSRKYEMGVVAMQRLDALINGRGTSPIRHVLYTDLIVRESTAAPS